MKKLFVCFVCVLLFGVFCGCAAEKTQTMNYEDIAVEMTALMYSGDYEGAAEFISKDAVGGLDASALEQIALGTSSIYGDYLGVMGIEKASLEEYAEYMGLGSDFDPSGYDNVVYFEGISFMNGNMGIYFIFDPTDRSVVGITVCGTEAKASVGDEDDSEADAE